MRSILLTRSTLNLLPNEMSAMHWDPPPPIDAASNFCENCGFEPLEPHAAVNSPMWYC